VPACTRGQRGRTVARCVATALRQHRGVPRPRTPMSGSTAGRHRAARQRTHGTKAPRRAPRRPAPTAHRGLRVPQAHALRRLAALHRDAFVISPDSTVDLAAHRGESSPRLARPQRRGRRAASSGPATGRHARPVLRRSRSMRAGRAVRHGKPPAVCPLRHLATAQPERPRSSARAHSSNRTSHPETRAPPRKQARTLRRRGQPRLVPSEHLASSWQDARSSS
jgi:hypothetical protein